MKLHVRSDVGMVVVTVFSSLGANVEGSSSRSASSIDAFSMRTMIPLLFLSTICI